MHELFALRDPLILNVRRMRVREQVGHLQAGKLLPQLQVQVVLGDFVAQLLNLEEVQLPSVQTTQKSDARTK